MKIRKRILSNEKEKSNFMPKHVYGLINIKAIKEKFKNSLKNEIINNNISDINNNSEDLNILIKLSEEDFVPQIVFNNNININKSKHIPIKTKLLKNCKSMSSPKIELLNNEKNKYVNLPRIKVPITLQKNKNKLMMNSFNKQNLLPNIDTIVSCRNLKAFSLLNDKTKTKKKIKSIYDNCSLSNDSKFRNIPKKISYIKNLVDQHMNCINSILQNSFLEIAGNISLKSIN